MARRRDIDPTVATNIRTRREQLGLSIRLAASRAGISDSMWGKVEKGLVSADNRFTLAAIATGLACAVTDLTGQTAPGADQQTRQMDEAAYEAACGVVEADLEFPPMVAAQPLRQLAAQVDELREARKSCDFLRVNRRAPAVIRALHAVAATAGADRDAALRLYVQAAENAAVGLRFTPQVVATAQVAERAHQAAQLLGDPVMLALAAWSRAQAALACGLYRRGVLIAERAYDALSGHDGDGGVLEMRGMLLLTAAFSQFADGAQDDARAKLAEAVALARRTGDTDTYGLMFGPTNVQFWAVAMESDGPDPGKVLAIAKGINPAVVQSANRQASFHLDMARALGRMGQVEPATRQLLVAERLAPQRATSDPLVAETARGLLHTVRRKAGSKELRGLCERVGVLV